MTAQVTESLDQLGPVDWIVVEFPGSQLKGEMRRSSRTTSTAT